MRKTVMLTGMEMRRDEEDGDVDGDGDEEG
jgi:hypothetical protein